MDDYMTKPFLEKQLRDTLSRWQSEKKGAAMESEGKDIRQESTPPKKEGTDGNTNERKVGTSPPIDRKALEQIAALKPKGTADILHEVISSYLSSSMDLLRKMRDALPAGDARVLHRAAHSLKSSSANLGALALSGLCAELEAMCRMERMEGAPALVAAIEDEYDRVRAALELELDCSARRHGDSGHTQGKRD
jgi:two-component system, sensor histidine kinase and response regulator